MVQSRKAIGDRTTTLLTLRKCARSNAAALGRTLDIDRKKALYHIRKLEMDGLVSGYIPEVIPTVFGTPYLVRILINPKQYQFAEELESTISSLINFLKTGIGHAPLTVYVYQAQKQDDLQINCITMTTDIEVLTKSLYRKQNVAKDTITTHVLNQAHGIPMYSKFSSVIDSELEEYKTSTSKARRK
ncbi:MAG: hypothetical protein ACTSWA_04085 [Candidatus Thorarchaeota archaeon]